MNPIIRFLLLAVIALLSLKANAASYSLPADIGNGPFSNCTGLGTVYICIGDVKIKNKDTVVLTSDISLSINGKLDIGKDVIISNSGFVFDINVSGDADIDDNSSVTANISTAGDFNMDKNASFTGNIVSGGDIDIDKNINITGDVTAAGKLTIGNGTLVVGVCTPSHPQCNGGGGPGTGPACTVTQIASNGEEFKGISGSSDSDVYAVGKNGSIYHFDGLLWTQDSFVAGEELRDIEVVSPNLVFAAGKKGEVVSYDGSTWSTLPAPSNDDLNGVWAASATEAWVVGNKDALFRWNGAVWQDMSGAAQANVDNNAELRDAWGGVGSFYALEKDGDLYHYSRTTGPWTKISACNSAFNMDVHDIWGDGAGNIYIAGKDKGTNPDEATVFLYNEGTGVCSKAFSTTSENDFEGVYGDGGIVYAVGKDGLVADNSAGAWVESRDGSEDLKDVWVSSSGQAYYVGKGGSATICVGLPSAVDHFNINVGAGAANTCNPFSFSVTAADSANNPITDYAGTVSLNTNVVFPRTPHGNFSTVTATNPINPNPDNDDNGSASYTFDTLDNGVITLALTNEHAETLSISVTDSTVPVTSTSADVTFSDNAFTILDNDGLVAGTDIAIAGRDHAYQIQMIRRDPLLGCGVSAGYSGLKPLKLWRTQNAIDPSPVNPLLEGNSLPAADPVVSNGNITFVSGEANVSLVTSDIGKFTIELADISNTFADITIAGTSAEQTVRPFGLAVTNIVAGVTPNPGASTPAGTVFTGAGSNFSSDVAAVLWDSADDTNNDGLLDAGSYDNNIPVPSYAWDTTLSALTSGGFEPAGGVVGTLNNGNLLQAEFAAGSFNVNDLQYTEVGSFTLQSAAIDFLNTTGADIAGQDIVVGRFTPASFEITATDDGMFANSCTTGATSFSYIGETFEYDPLFLPSFSVSALNALSDVTLNYTGSWAKLDDDSISFTQPTSDETQTGSDSLTLMALSYTQSVTKFNITDNADGTFEFEFSGDGFVFDRDANSEISEFDADIDLLVTEVRDLDNITNSGSFTLSPTMAKLRFGRIRMSNLHGSELIDLSMPMFAEYLLSGAYVVNTDDNACTNVTTTDLIITDNLSTAGSSTVSVINSPAILGDIGVSLSAPGAGIVGDITVSPSLTGLADWLQYDWDGVGVGLFDDDPSAIATFGIYSGNDVNIYKLQIYQ